MQLNYDCVRDVLLTIEDQLGLGEEWTIQRLSSLLPDYSEDDLSYACLKLYEAHYINAMTYSLPGVATPLIARVQDITYQGHEMLENIRPQDVFEQAKDKIKQTVGSASLEILCNVVSSIVTKTLGL